MSKLGMISGLVVAGMLALMTTASAWTKGIPEPAECTPWTEKCAEALYLQQMRYDVAGCVRKVRAATGDDRFDAYVEPAVGPAGEVSTPFTGAYGKAAFLFKKCMAEGGAQEGAKP